MMDLKSKTKYDYPAKLVRVVDGDTSILVVSQSFDNYGRWLAEVYDSVTGENLSDVLMSSGHAAPYKG